MGNCSRILVAGFLASIFANVAVDKFFPQTREQKHSAVQQERAHVDARCEKWDLRQSEKGDYDWHSGARREGCQAASLAFGPVAHQENRDEGTRLWLLLTDPKNPRTESTYYAYKKLKHYQFP